MDQAARATAEEALMKRRVFGSIGALGVAIAMTSLAPAPVSGQAPARAQADKSYTAPRTPDGKPDLQGVWDYRTATPLALDLPIPAMVSSARVEPGVFGIRKPVLLLPDRIAERMLGRMTRKRIVAAPAP